MGWLQRMQTGAIQASFRQVGWTVTTPSAVPDGSGTRARQPDLPKRAEVPPATTLVQTERVYLASRSFASGLVPRLPVSHGRSRLGQLFDWFQVVSEARAV